MREGQDYEEALAAHLKRGDRIALIFLLISVLIGVVVLITVTTPALIVLGVFCIFKLAPILFRKD